MQKVTSINHLRTSDMFFEVIALTTVGAMLVVALIIVADFVYDLFDK